MSQASGNLIFFLGPFRGLSRILYQDVICIGLDPNSMIENPAKSVRLPRNILQTLHAAKPGINIIEWATLPLDTEKLMQFYHLYQSSEITFLFPPTVAAMETALMIVGKLIRPAVHEWVIKVLVDQTDALTLVQGFSYLISGNTEIMECLEDTRNHVLIAKFVSKRIRNRGNVSYISNLKGLPGFLTPQHVFLFMQNDPQTPGKYLVVADEDGQHLLFGYHKHHQLTEQDRRYNLPIGNMPNVVDKKPYQYIRMKKNFWHVLAKLRIPVADESVEQL